MLTSFDDSKKIINSKNLINECFRFNQRSLWPAIVPIPYCLLYMLQSGEYIFTPEFITFYKKIDLEEANVMWSMIHHPSATTLDMILKLIFNGRSYSPRDLDKCRYFMIAASNLSSSMSASQYNAVSRHDSKNQTQSTASHIIDTIRAANVVRMAPQLEFNDDFIQLDDDQCSTASNNESTCPEHIDDMLIIVRKLRTQSTPVSTSTSSSSSSSVNMHDSTPQSNISFYESFNITNLFSG